MFAQHGEGRRWQGNPALLGTLSPVDMKHHGPGVDIGDLEMLRFLEPQPTGVDRGQEGMVVRRAHAGEESSDLVSGEDDGEFMLAPGVDEGEGVPLALEDVLEEEAQAAVVSLSMLPDGNRRDYLQIA